MEPDDDSEDEDDAPPAPLGLGPSPEHPQARKRVTSPQDKMIRRRRLGMAEAYHSPTEKKKWFLTVFIGERFLRSLVHEHGTQATDDTHELVLRAHDRADVFVGARSFFTQTFGQTLVKPNALNLTQKLSFGDAPSRFASRHLAPRTVRG